MDRDAPQVLTLEKAAYPHVQLFIDGQWCGGASGRTLQILNPATGAPIATLARAEIADLDRALAAADKGFKTWRKVSALSLIHI